MLPLHFYQAVGHDISSHREEVANVLTHGLGLLLAAWGVGVLLTAAGPAGWSPDARLGGVVFGGSLVLMYAASTAYHLANQPQWRRWLRTVDHIAIYFLISGTYTPFVLLFVNNTSGHMLLTGLWAVTAAGMVLKLLATHRFQLFSTLLYLAMGWAVVFVFDPLVSAAPPAVIWWIVAGGAAYTLGVVFYLWRSLPYHHAIWHLCVLAGSGSHFMAVWLAIRG